MRRDRMVGIAKEWLFRYQIIMYYIAQTAGEYGKIAGFVNNISLGAVFLATVLNIHLTLKQLILIWIILMVTCYIMGRLIVKSGITAYNAKLSNKQNPELLEILEWVRSQKQK